MLLVALTNCVLMAMWHWEQVGFSAWGVVAWKIRCLGGSMPEGFSAWGFVAREIRFLGGFGAM